MKRLAILIFIAGIICSLYQVPVQAAALPAELDAVMMEELAMAIHAFLQTGFIAGGGSHGLEAYEENVRVNRAFMRYLNEHADVSGRSGYLDGTILKCTTLTGNPFEVYCHNGSYDVLVDGEVMYSGAQRDLVDDLELPSKDRYNEFRLINGGGSDPDKDPFTRIQKIAIGSGFTAGLVNFVNLASKGNIDGIDSEALWHNNELIFSQYKTNSEGQFIYNFKAKSKASSVNYKEWSCENLISDNMIAGLYSSGKFTFYLINGINVSDTGKLQLKYVVTYYSDGHVNESNQQLSSLTCDTFAANFPVFNSVEALKAFVETSDTSGIVNGESLITSQVASVPNLSTVLGLATGLLFQPTDLGLIAQDAYAAAEALPDPAPGTSPGQYTQAYTNSVQQAVTQSVAQAAPETVPNTNPETKPETNPDPSNPEPSDYKVDLTSLFPFCLPFDLIRIIDVLDAEPEAPRFEIPVLIQPLNINEVVVIDLSFMNDVMVIFRTGLLISFILGLILVTQKLIKW